MLDKHLFLVLFTNFGSEMVKMAIKEAISWESRILTLSGQAVLAGSIFKCQHIPETLIVT